MDGRGLNSIAETILQGIVPVKEGNFAVFHPVLTLIQRGMWTKKRNVSDFGMRMNTKLQNLCNVKGES